MTGVSTAPVEARRRDDDVPDAAPLRDAPVWEIVVRLVLAHVVVVVMVVGTADYLARPKTVRVQGQPFDVLLSEVNAGRVDRVDVDGNWALWRSTDGAVYQTSRFFGLSERRELRAAVERQPYVRDNPGAVTFGSLDRTEWSEDAAVKVPMFVLWAVIVWRLFHGPFPRVATLWGWFWVVATPPGILAYLFLSGSWVRAAPAYRAPPARRLGGVASILLVAAAHIAVFYAGNALHDARHPVRPVGDHVPMTIEPL